MRRIVKHTEPQSLAQHRCTPHADYENLKTEKKDELRQSLVNEQRGLCCYCMQRIRPTKTEMKIEHWQSYERYPDLRLDYSNLLGACLGNQGQPEENQHRDTRKGKDPLKFNPADASHRVDQQISFSADGTIKARDPEFDRQLNDVLNLNLKFLINNRKAALDAFKATLPVGELKRPRIEAMIAQWTGQSHVGSLEPFAEVVVYWLRRKLQSTSNTR
jgi:uncharacterized protein (TIGR02646 family)